jgi:hypothetical protein
LHMLHTTIAVVQMCNLLQINVQSRKWCFYIEEKKTNSGRTELGTLQQRNMANRSYRPLLFQLSLYFSCLPRIGELSIIQVEYSIWIWWAQQNDEWLNVYKKYREYQWN